ncbi:gephyrin-like molybdotransferase receptor GlpR [Mycobacterium sp. PDNC021]|uniref:divisome protein SepX/GlpR n=1 Tax=Mycobacterium sp. PDNC021 TaxID=3391399 RepID=UPI003AB022C4
MPSIPQSLLWISLVVLWLFVLVPMLISKRENVRRTSDVALATRVLNTNGNSRLRRRSGPATGHFSDPHWKQDEDLTAFEEDFARSDATTDSIPVADPEADSPRSVVLADQVVVEESAYLDVEVVEMDSGALPIGASGRMKAVPEPETREQPTLFDEVATPTMAIRTVSEADFEPEEALTDEMAAADADAPEVEAEPTTDVHEAVAADEADEAVAEQAEEEAEDGTEHDYEYVDDTSGVEAVSEDEPKLADSMSHVRRNRYESKAAVAAAERKYRFRSRMLSGMAVAILVTGVVAFSLASSMWWWFCGMVSAASVLYLAYLRRQTRIEEQLRRRRAQRMMRSRHGVENTQDEEFDVVPSRLRRPGAAVLDIDDEDPIFEHLEYARMGREYDLPRAAGQ